MRAAILCLIVLAIGCGPEGPAAKLEVAAPKGPSAQQALYPPTESVLTAAAGVRFLPADTPLVIAVANLATLVRAAGMAREFESGGEPYDQSIGAVTSWAAGLAIDDVATLADAGIDGGATWSAAWLEVEGIEPDRLRFGIGAQSWPFDARVVFGPVADEAKLRARLKSSAEERKRELIVEPLGKGTFYRTKEEAPESALLIREGVAFFIRGIDAKGDVVTALAKTIASVDPASSLRDAPGYQANVQELGFGDHAGVYLQPHKFIRRAIAGIERERDKLRESFDQLQKALDDEDVEHSEEDIARYRRRLAVREDELAFPEKRIAALENLGDGLSGIALGLDFGATTMRAKVHVGFKEGGSPLRAVKLGEGAPLLATLAGSDKPRGGLQLTVEPAYMRELLSIASSELTTRRIETQLRQVGVDVDAGLESVLDGRIALARLHGAEKDGEGKIREDAGGAWVMSLGLKDAARAKEILDKWLAGEDAKAMRTEGLLKPHADGVTIELPRGEEASWLRIADTQIIVASSKQAFEAALAPIPDASSWWLARAADPLVAGLAAARGDGFGLLDARYGDAFDLPEAWRMRSSPFFGNFGMPSSIFASDIFGGLGGFGRSESKRAEKLRKKRDEIRADIATLEERQTLARRTGGDRLTTALGTTVGWLDATPTGATIYAAQMLDEENLAALGEWVVWAIVDNSSASSTAREIVKLQKKLKDVEAALDEENGNATVSFGAMEGLTGLGSLEGSMGTMGILERGIPDGVLMDASGGGVGIGGIGTTGGTVHRGARDSAAKREKPQAGSGSSD